MLKRIRRFGLRAFLVAGVLVPIGVVACNLWVTRSTRSSIFTNGQALPLNDVGLVLGAGPMTWDGRMNPHFKARIEGAAYLFKIGKVKRLLLSGAAEDNEPADMRRALTARGVPESALTLDNDGFRTLDSVARAHEVFGVDRLTVITDDFHAPRAVFLARHFGISAVAYCPQPVPWLMSAGARLREIAARVKAVLDVYILFKQPRFLGPKVGMKPEVQDRH